MMDRFSNDFLISTDMQNWESNVVLNNSIHYDKYSVLIDKRIFIDII